MIFLAVYDPESQTRGKECVGPKIVQTRPEMRAHLKAGAGIIEAEVEVLYGPCNWMLQNAETAK